MTRLLLACLFALLVACNGKAPEHGAATDSATAAPRPPAPPEAAAAATLIAESAEFSEFEFTNAGYSLALKSSAMNAPARAVAKELAAAGWISFRGDDVVLAKKAEGDRRWLVRPNGFVDIVPLAKKEFIAVTGLEPQNDGTVAAAFSWRWIPNDIAQAFHQSELYQRYDGDRRTTATLMWDGSHWTVLRITKLS